MAYDPKPIDMADVVLTPEILKLTERLAERAQGVTDFTCDYVGQTSMAKGYGTFSTYHVRRLR